MASGCVATHGFEDRHYGPAPGTIQEGIVGSFWPTCGRLMMKIKGDHSITSRYSLRQLFATWELGVVTVGTKNENGKYATEWRPVIL
jgi:hypothetical protein